MVCAVNLVQPQPKLLHPKDPNRRLTERNSAWLENMESAGPGLGEASQIWVMGYLELQNGLLSLILHLFPHCIVAKYGDKIFTVFIISAIQFSGIKCSCSYISRIPLIMSN